MSKTYNQDCVLAYAFDILGERWTFLIIRELFLGPRRYGDLHASLPGISTNLLSKRLKELEDAGLITTTGDGRGRYRLTEFGDGLRPTLRALVMWGIEYFMSRPDPSPARECILSNDLNPDSVVLAIEMKTCRSAIAHTNYVLHLHIDDSLYTYYFMNGEMFARRGVDAPAVARIDADVATLMQAMRGELSLDEARGRCKTSGDDGVISHLFSSIVPDADITQEVAEIIEKRALKRRIMSAGATEEDS